MFDKWMFALCNLSHLLDRPRALQDRVFDKFFEQAEIAKYSDDERQEYESSVKDYRDYINTLDTAHQRGWAEGKAEGRAEGEQSKAQEIATKLKSMGMSTEEIAKVTGLDSSDEELER